MPLTDGSPGGLWVLVSLVGAVGFVGGLWLLYWHEGPAEQLGLVVSLVASIVGLISLRLLAGME